MATHKRTTDARAKLAPVMRDAPRTSLPFATAHSSETGRTYRLDRLIGKGGFGEVYLATTAPHARPAHVCIKVTERLTAWLREADFAELLYSEPRALRVLDRFVILDAGRTLYCVARERGGLLIGRLRYCD